jgi:putative ABC transport system substrate-binding protein
MGDDRLRRRQFSRLVGALVGSNPFLAFGQSNDKPTVGVLGYASEAASRPYVEGLRDGLGKYGLQLLKEAVPAARTFAVFLQASNPGNPEFRKAFGNVSQALGVRIVARDIRAVEEFHAAFDWAVQQSADGALVLQDPSFDTHRETIFRLALEHRMPTVTGNAQTARAGALLAYALDFVDVWRQSARYVSEILRGADPALLPIEQATAFKVLVNMKTARALGLTLPLSLLARADEVIE